MFIFGVLLMQLLILSASANKLSKLKERAEEYASLIMEELDPENLGYIEVKCSPISMIFQSCFLGEFHLFQQTDGERERGDRIPCPK